MIVGPILAQHAGTVRGEPVRHVSLEKVLRDEIAEQQHQHERRLEQLESLKKGLQSADAREAQVEELDRLIAEETRDYRARIAFLRQISRPVLAEGELPQSRLRSTVGSELNDLAQAIGSLNQSYVIAPSVGPGAATGGSGFIDYEDVAEESRVARPADEDAPLHVPQGCPCGRTCWGKCPPWLYGEVPRNWISPAVANELARSIEQLRTEVARLRGEVEQLQDRPTRKETQ